MGWLEQQREKQKREAQSRKLASEFARGLDTPSGNPLFDSAYWDEVGSGVMDAINRGGVAGLVGASVDIVNTVMRPIGLGSDKPVMGSEWIGDRMQQAGIVSGTRNPIAETLAGFVDPATIAPFAMKAAAVAIPALAAFGATAIGSKANKGAKLSDLAQAMPKQRGIFAGVGAKTADLNNLDLAKKLQAQGVPDDVPTSGRGVAMSAPAKTEFELAHELAQRNAALPIEQGGLGLPPNNTAMDRARAMAGLKMPEYSRSNLLAGKVEVKAAKEGKPLFKNPDSLINDGVVVDEKAKNYLSAYLDHNQLDRVTGELRGKGVSKAREILSDAKRKMTSAKFKDYTKEELKMLAESDIVKRAHEIGRMEFKPITKEQFFDKSNLLIHKSPSYGKTNPGSEYRIGVVNGEPVYMRSANHWGEFGTNIGYKTPEEEVLKQGLGVGDYYENVSGFGDPFARVGKQFNQWDLPGYERGQIGYGYIPLNELSGRLPEKNFVSHISDNYTDLPIIKLPDGQYRSRFAAFDPMQRNSANILAGGAAGAIGLSTLADLLNQEQYQ